MLTKDESDKLKNEIDCLLTHAQINKVIDKFTEKPIRKIEVGDIYRNTDGRLVEITRDDGDNVVGNMESGYKKVGGKNVNGTRCNLDLSKRYKILEIEDVD